MKFNKKLLFTSIFLVILLQISQINNKVFANDTVYNNISNLSDNNSLDNNYKFNSKIILNEGLTNDDGSELKTFKVEKNDLYFKVSINNKSDHYYGAILTKDKVNGEIFGEFGINPNSSSSFIVPFYVYNSNLSTFKNIYVSVFSQSGYKLNGSITIQVYTNNSDINL